MGSPSTILRRSAAVLIARLRFQGNTLDDSPGSSHIYPDYNAAANHIEALSENRPPFYSHRPGKFAP